LFPIADKLVLTEVSNPRTASIEKLRVLAKEFSTANIESATASEVALQIARDQTPLPGMICITGSLYLVGEVRGRLIGGQQYD